MEANGAVPPASAAAPTTETVPSGHDLKRSLVDGYHELRTKLTARLGSESLAEEALQESYLKLERSEERADIQSPQAYLLRMAMNFVTDQRRARRRLLSTEEVSELLAIDDQQPGPAAAAESAAEFGALQQVLAELPERQQSILLASRVDETPHKEIAARFGVSTRTIEMELKRALEYCARRMGRRLTRRFGPGAGQSS